MARTAGGGVRGLVKIEGAAELDRALLGLDRKIAKKLARRALRVGAKIIQAEAKQLAPVQTGQLRDSIKVRAAKRRRKGSLAIQVITGEGDFQGEEFYASFIEYGFMKQPVQSIGGKLYSLPRGQGEPTHFPPRPFMRPAFERKGDEAANAVATTLRDEIEQAAKTK